jgi:pyrroline-5-carboxylate reductase
MKIGCIGGGKMAGALVRGLLKAGVCTAEEIIVSDCSQAALDALKIQTGVRGVSSNKEAVSAADVVLLCVKPGDAAAALGECRAELAGKALISIVAGLSIDGMRTRLGKEARVIRAMPNTPAVVGVGATAYAPGDRATAADLDAAKRIFESIGIAVEVPEKWLDAVTGLSGSGPAYVFLVMEALADGGVAAGLPRALAQQLAVQTVLGAATLAKESGEHPSVLREAVTSPGGTTAAALGVLEAAAMRSAFTEAVAAAAERSRELGE